MKICVLGHCAVDTIKIEDSKYEQIGGSACYCGLTARQFGFDVELQTKFGKDFPKQYLSDNKIKFINSESENDTTHFKIEINGSDRKLILENFCEDIIYESTKCDGHLVSPIFNEISDNSLSKIKKDSNFLLIDPQ